MKIYFIEKEKFLRDLVEKKCKREGIDIFTDDNCENSTYLITDFAPDFIVIDQATILPHIDKTLETLRDNQVTQIPLVVTLSKGDNLTEELGVLASKVIKKPLVAEALIKDFTEIKLNG